MSSEDLVFSGTEFNKSAIFNKSSFNTFKLIYTPFQIDLA